MTGDLSQFVGILGLFVVLLFITGFYCILLTQNLIRTLIGIEIVAKAVTLLIIASGYVTDNSAYAQAMVITMIIIEVVVIVVAAGIVLNVFNKCNSLDNRNLKNLKG